MHTTLMAHCIILLESVLLKVVSAAWNTSVDLTDPLRRIPPGPRSTQRKVAQHEAGPWGGDCSSCTSALICDSVHERTCRTSGDATGAKWPEQNALKSSHCHDNHGCSYVITWPQSWAAVTQFSTAGRVRPDQVTFHIPVWPSQSHQLTHHWYHCTGEPLVLSAAL